MALRYTLRQLAYFTAAADRLSISDAAASLHVSAPAVSAAVAHLETVLGTQLFVRHHARGLTVTASGRRLAAAARRLLAQAAALDGSEAEATVQGVVDVGCFVTFAPYFMPALVTRLQRAHPGIELRILEADAEGLTRGLLQGTLDLALVYAYDLSERIEHERLTELPPYAVLPADGDLARQHRVSLAALAEAPFILLDLPISRDYLRGIFLQHGLSPRIHHRAQSYEMVRGLVAQGHGVALLNLFLPNAMSYDGSRLAARPLAEPTGGLVVALAQLRGNAPTRAAAAVGASIRDHFATPGLGRLPQADPADAGMADAMAGPEQPRKAPGR